MAEEKRETKGISRREFLKDAGLVVGGATIGSMAFVSACGGGSSTVTKTVTGGTTTVTAPPTTVTVNKFVDPYDGQTFATQDALKAHMDTAQPQDTRTTFNVNGVNYKVDIQPWWSLGFVLREKLGLTALKFGCDRGECGHCTVIVDGKTVYSCLMLALEAVGSKVVTAESLSTDLMNLDPVAKAFRDNNAFQCGFCTSGVLLSTKALLASTPKPTLQQAKEGLSGHLCVCSGWKKMLNTVVGLGG